MTWAIWALFKARGWASAGIAWLTASAAHLLLACCVILACWAGWERHQASGWRHVADKWHTSADRWQDALRALQIAADEAKAQSTAIAKDNTHEHETRLAGDLALARNYSRNNRVQICAKPAASGQSADPGVPVAAASVPVLVAVSEPDIDACTRNYDFALSASEWAKSLVDAGLGEVAR